MKEISKPQPNINDTIENEILMSEKKEEWLMDKLKNLFNKKQPSDKKTNSEIKKFSPKKLKRILYIVVIWIIAAIIGLWFDVYIEHQKLNNILSRLYELDTYSVSVSQDNINTIKDYIQYGSSIKVDSDKYTQYQEDLALSYEYFLQYIYFPWLNIWKDPFTNEIDTTLVGRKYLEKNPYEDIKLIEKWTSFFKDVGNSNWYNQIDDIQLWDINQTEDGFFSIPLSVKFVSTSKRSFLLLINKLAVTSSKENIWLINEFMYYVWKEIKSQKVNAIANISKEYSGWNEDKIIGYELYNRIFNNWTNNLIDNNVVDQAIRANIGCDKETSKTLCYYRFREKYASLWTLAYYVWFEKNSDQVKWIKEFLQSIPMVMILQDFSFDKYKGELVGINNTKYAGEIKINLIGRGITQEWVQEVSTILWESCIGSNLNPDNVLSYIESKISELADTQKLNVDRSKNLWEMKVLIQNVLKEYPSMNNYLRLIKLFEIHRMLSEWWICKI